jgi:nucleoside-diphosphate-sugar epimerase
MARFTALIAGASGHVGSQLASELVGSGGWDVVALSRQSTLDCPDVQNVHVDLLGGDVAGAISTIAKPTHVFYCVRAPFKEGGLEDVEGNLAMLRAVVEAAETGNPDLRHVHIVEGGKWYGAHLGPYATPAREDAPRHNGDNFYYSQEDWLRERQAGKDWTWSASRPSYVCAVTPGKGRNLVSTVGAYAALCWHEGKPLAFPGSERSFASLTEVTEASLLARAMIFMAVTPAAANQAFNVTNGDAIRWSELWPKLAAYFQVQPSGPTSVPLAKWSQAKDAVWDRLVREQGLQIRQLSEVANWSFGDFVFGQDYDVLSDVSKIRDVGFRESIDTAAMFFNMLKDYRARRILP